MFPIIGMVNITRVWRQIKHNRISVNLCSIYSWKFSLCCLFAFNYPSFMLTDMKCTIYGVENRPVEADVNHDRNMVGAHVKIHQRVLFHRDTLPEIIILQLPPMGVPSNIHELHFILEGFTQSVCPINLISKLHQWWDFCSGRQLGPAGNSKS